MSRLGADQTVSLDLFGLQSKDRSSFWYDGRRTKTSRQPGLEQAVAGEYPGARWLGVCRRKPFTAGHLAGKSFQE